MIAISTAIIVSTLIVNANLIYAVYTWAKVKEKEQELEDKLDSRHGW